MPDVDLAWVANDTAVAGEAFTIVRRRTWLDANGIVQKEAVTLPAPGAPAIVGGISPTGENSLVREEAFQTQSNAILVITDFPLRGASIDPGTNETYQPDLVFYKGSYYEVRTLDDYTSYGAGFIACECLQVTYRDPVTAV